MQITEIFKSIQGEGTRAGLPCIFVRLTGCNLRCVWCDTAYAFHGGTKMTVEEVLAKVNELAGAGVNRISLVELTGGEPLLQPEIVPLAEGEYDVSGRLSIHYWPQLFGLPRFSERVATVGGLIPLIVAVALIALDVELALVAEGGVEARPVHARGRHQIVERRAVVAIPPEHVGGARQRDIGIIGARPPAAAAFDFGCFLYHFAKNP